MRRRTYPRGEEPGAPREPFFFSSFFFPPRKQETESPIKNGKSGDRGGKKKSFAYLSSAAARLSAACHRVDTPGDVAAIMGPPARPRAP